MVLTGELIDTGEIQAFLIQGTLTTLGAWGFRILAVKGCSSIVEGTVHKPERPDKTMKEIEQLEHSEKWKFMDDDSLSTQDVCKKLDLEENTVEEYRRFQRLKLERIEEIDKRAEQIMKAFVFVVLCGFGFRAARESPSWANPSLLWEYRPITNLQRRYYLVEFGWYMHRTITAPCEYTRSDWWTMVIHHFVTSALILLSYIHNWHEIGCMVMFLHDPNDAVLAATKTVHYLKMSPLDDVGFVIFFIMWIVFRLYLYLVYPVYSSLICPSLITLPARICKTLLIALAGLNIWWFYLILKVLAGKLSTGKVRDVRSGNESGNEAS